MSSADRAANVLGALSLVVSDQMSLAITQATGQSPSSTAALSALAEFLKSPTLDELRNVLGLTHSGAVRLIDRLVEQNLVQRDPGADGRSRAITLTGAGRRTAAQISAIRIGQLRDLFTGLSDRQLDVANALMTRLMTNAVNAKDGGAWICRLCDLHACERSEGRCPAAKAAAVKYAPR